MLNFLKQFWNHGWSVIGGFLSFMARLFGHYPPIPKAAHEHITPDDIAAELRNARNRELSADSVDQDIDTRIALIWGYANASAGARSGVDLGSLSEMHRNGLLLMSDENLRRLASSRLLCAQWHLLDGKFPRRMKSEVVQPPSKREAVSTALRYRVHRMHDRHSPPWQSDLPEYSYRNRP